MLALVVGLLPSVVLALWRWNDGFGITAGDWAQYMLHARALLAHHHYADIGYLYSRYNPWIGPPAEPPGLPLTLVPVMALFGPSLTAAHVLMALSLAAGLTCVWLYFAPRQGSWAAAAIIAFCGVMVISQGGVNNVLADAGFLALVWTVVLLVDHDEPLTLRRLALVTIVGALAVAYRTAGAALVPGLVLYAIVARRPRVLIPVAVWGLLSLVFLARMRTASNVLSAVSTSPKTILALVIKNADTYAHAVPAAFLRPVEWSQAIRLYQVAALVVALLGAALLLRTRWRKSFAVSFAVCYLAMLLVVAVQDGRYLWPIVPLIVAALVVGARWIAGRVAGARAPLIAAAAAVAVVGGTVVAQGTKPRIPDFSDLPQVRRIFALADSLHRTDSARFVFANPRVLTWYTGTPAMVLFAATPDQTMAELRRARITHVVLGDVGDLAPQDSSMRRAMAANAGSFRFLRRDGQFEVYRMLPDSGSVSAR